MFFAPPKVKSLSRYAEYGPYLGNRHFLVMLAIAITAHLSIIAVYSMLPREEIIRIPVRALNIKLTGGSTASLHTPQVPSVPSVTAAAPAQPNTQAEEEEMPSLRDTSPEVVVDKAITKKTDKVQTMKVPVAKIAHTAKEKQKGEHAVGQGFSTPKRYVRGSEESAAKAHKKDGNGSNIGGVAGGQEVISRYTQVVSQWIINHQAMAKAACGEAKAVTGECNAKGQAVVRLRINRDGRILSNTVEHTSGSELVDQAAIVMVRASDPVPSVPNDYPSDSQLEFLITVQVDLSVK